MQKGMTNKTIRLVKDEELQATVVAQVAMAVQLSCNELQPSPKKLADFPCATKVKGWQTYKHPIIQRGDTPRHPNLVIALVCLHMIPLGEESGGDFLFDSAP